MINYYVGVGQVIPKDTRHPGNATAFEDIGDDTGALTHLYKVGEGWYWGTREEYENGRTYDPTARPFDRLARFADGDLRVVAVEDAPFKPGDRVEYIGHSLAKGWTGRVKNWDGLNPIFQVRVTWDNGMDTYTTPLVNHLRKIEEEPATEAEGINQAAVTQTVRAHVLDEAKRITATDRNSSYGEPEDNFQRIANFWNVWLQDKLKDGVKLTPGDTAAMQIMVKLAREMNAPVDDNKIDIAGYAACWAQVDHREEK